MEAIVEDYICFISTHLCAGCSSYSHSRINKTANWSIIVVSMALTPAIVAIFGGLPVNFLEGKFKVRLGNSSSTNDETKSS